MQPEKPQPKAAQDADLCARSRAGDDEALSLLMKRYSHLIFEKAGSVYCRGLERDDLYQEGMIALFRAVMTYEEGKGASFRTYALTCVTNRFRDLLRKSGGAIVSVSMDDIQLPHLDGPENEIIARDELERLGKWMQRSLSEKERAILLCYLSGMSYAEIAQWQGCDVKSVSNALLRVRKKLKH